MTTIRHSFFTVFIFMIVSPHAFGFTENKSTLKPMATNSFVLAISTGQKITHTDQLPQKFQAAQEVLLSYQLKNGTYKTLISFKANSTPAMLENLSKMSDEPQTIWAHPLIDYEGDPREETPNDAKYEKQLHHPIMKNDLAWDFQKGNEEIVVAVTDDGVKTTHEDLKENIWVNSAEIPGNKIDDDGNGFIDDVNGWDFSDDDNNPNPSSGSHGTHVAGIIAASINNTVGVAGTAPKVKVMPLRFYGGRNRWNAAIVLKSYRYAVDNGAKIITTSFNIDSFKGSPIYQEALNYAYENGVLVFNSAGNSGANSPRRASFDKVVLVMSTNVKSGTVDKKSSFSNYGLGLDICAPGSNIYSTVKGGYREMSGTSMASPNAAAVAALIWSANPQWDHYQVAAQLMATADNIDEKNTSYRGKLGAGRLNSFEAVTQTIRPPKIIRLKEILDGGKLSSSQKELTVITSSVFGPNQLGQAGAFTLTFEGKDKKFGTNDDKTTILTSSKKYAYGTNLFPLQIGPLKKGRYQFQAMASKLKGPFGQTLDGNADGKSGDNFVVNFSVK